MNAGPGVKPWWVMLEVPVSVTNAEALKVIELQKDLQVSAIINALTVALIAVLIGSAIMWFAASTITRPINNVANMLKEIASGKGDLTQRLQYFRNDELVISRHGSTASWKSFSLL